MATEQELNELKAQIKAEEDAIAREQEYAKLKIKLKDLKNRNNKIYGIIKNVGEMVK